LCFCPSYLKNKKGVRLKNNEKEEKERETNLEKKKNRIEMNMQYKKPGWKLIFMYIHINIQSPISTAMLNTINLPLIPLRFKIWI